MPAMQKPIGSVPEKHGSDVKEKPLPTPSPEETKEPIAAKASEAQTQETESEPEITEDDLKEVEDTQKVPYSRFKSVNEEKKRALAEKEQLESYYKAELQKALLQQEVLRNAKTAQTEDEEVLDLTVDPNEKVIKKLVNEIGSLRSEVTNLKTKTSQESLQHKVNQAVEKFPKANRLAIMGILKHNPTLDVEAVAEELHQTVQSQVTEGIKNLIETKKRKAKEAKFPVSETGFIQLKDQEKPKSVKEANAKIAAFMKKLSF